MKPILDFIMDIFRFHKKKILFLLGCILFWFLVLFPYDDLSDFVTLKVTQATQSRVYLQFDGLSFGLMPQLGIMMDQVMVETAFAPPISMKTLGMAPKLSMIFGIPGGKIKAYDIFGGNAIVDIGPSNELEIQGQELNLNINLDDVALKELSKFIKQATQAPLNMSGTTNLQSQVYVDPTFKTQPQGQVEMQIEKLEIPSSNLSLQGMSMPLPALKLSNVKLRGSLKDGILNIKEGKIGSGEKNDNLYGEVTGDLEMRIVTGGKVLLTGYNLRVNLNISDNLKRQLSTVLGFVDLYKSIGSKYKFDSLKGVRYAMTLKARSMNSEPQVSSY